ncbi:putative phosphoesterase [Rhizobium sp. RU36D]|nr:putative phosphoesterase [Rhizobium sp. RU36D]
MTGLTARRLAAEDMAPAPVDIELHGVAAVCDPFGALYLPETRALVVSDLHLEKGAAFARRGQLLPPYDTLATLRLLEVVIGRYDPAVVISLGDNFHDRVGSALLPEMFREMISSMARGREWIWINGNHDPDGTVRLPGVSADILSFGGLTFRHEPTAAFSPGEVAGHLHPCATVRRREKSVRRPCFASDGARLVMPSFGVTTGGLDLRHKAFAGLFDRGALIAHLLGRERIYSVRFSGLLG